VRLDRRSPSSCAVVAGGVKRLTAINRSIGKEMRFVEECGAFATANPKAAGYPRSDMWSGRFCVELPPACFARPIA
jgi:hypothetical protein